MRIPAGATRPKDVSGYIAAAPAAARPMLRAIRTLIHRAAPDAIEKLSYGMPYYSDHGRLVYFAVFRSHVSVFVPGGTLDEFAAEVRPYRRGKATLRFDLGARLPLRLLERLVRARRRENERR